MLTTDTQLDIRVGGTSFSDGNFHKLSNAGLVNGSEWVFSHDVRLLISTQKGTGIITRHTEAGLGEVIGSEAEELSSLGDLVGGQSTTRHFDHRTHLVI